MCVLPCTSPMIVIILESHPLLSSKSPLILCGPLLTPRQRRRRFRHYHVELRLRTELIDAIIPLCSFYIPKASCASSSVRMISEPRSKYAWRPVLGCQQYSNRRPVRVLNSTSVPPLAGIQLPCSFRR